ncbi:hypothetical protein CHUAL_011322 [Chamberlinius hualienensis]
MGTAAVDEVKNTGKETTDGNYFDGVNALSFDVCFWLGVSYVKKWKNWTKTSFKYQILNSPLDRSSDPTSAEGKQAKEATGDDVLNSSLDSSSDPTSAEEKQTKEAAGDDG